MAKKITVSLLILFWLYMISPFIGAIGMGMVLAVIFHPWMKKIHHGRFPDTIAAGLFTLAVTLVIFLPISGLVIGSVNAGLTELKQLSSHMEPKPAAANPSDVVVDKILENSDMDSLLTRASKIISVEPEKISDQLKSWTTNLSTSIGEALTAFVSRIPSTLVSFAVFLFALFYFLADGVAFLKIIREKSFFNRSETEKLFTTFSGLCRSVIFASVVTGGIQATLATIVSLVVGMSRPLLIFPIIFIMSFIPVIGSFPVVIGIALYQLFNGHTISGVAFLVTALLIAAMDNFLRPQLIRGGSNLHPLLGFVSALAGIQFFGMPGLFLGPVICGVMIETIKIVLHDKTA